MIESIMTQIGDFFMAHKGIAMIVNFLIKHSNFIFGIIINFVLIFVLAFVYCDNLSVGRFFVMSLQLLLMQYSGYVSITALLPRVLCYLFCIVVGGVFLMLFNNLFRKHKDNKFVLEGCEEIASRLKSLLDEDASCKMDLFAITTNFCKSKYHSMQNQDYLLDEATKNDFLALIGKNGFCNVGYTFMISFAALRDKILGIFCERINFLIRIFFFHLSSPYKI
jgi:hypothetical protein